MKRPVTLKVLGREVTLEANPPATLPDCYGRALLDDRVIQIRNDLTGFDEVDTVVHEVMHAVRWGQGRPYQGEVEEDYVTSLATGLTHVLRDNPALLRWIASTLRNDNT